MKTTYSLWALLIPLNLQLGIPFPRTPFKTQDVITVSDSNLYFVEIMFLKLVDIFLLFHTMVITSKILTTYNKILSVYSNLKMPMHLRWFMS